MKASTFFQYCHEVVEFRWEPRVCADGRIYFIRFVEHYLGYGEPISPIPAVAVELYGSRVKNTNDVWGSARILELPKDFTRLLFRASIAKDDLTPRAAAVREELLHSIGFPALPNVDIKGLFR